MEKAVLIVSSEVVRVVTIIYVKVMIVVIVAAAALIIGEALWLEGTNNLKKNHKKYQLVVLPV